MMKSSRLIIIFLMEILARSAHKQSIILINNN